MVNFKNNSGNKAICTSKQAIWIFIIVTVFIVISFVCDLLPCICVKFVDLLIYSKLRTVFLGNLNFRIQSSNEQKCMCKWGVYSLIREASNRSKFTQVERNKFFSTLLHFVRICVFNHNDKCLYVPFPLGFWLGFWRLAKYHRIV